MSDRDTRALIGYLVEEINSGNIDAVHKSIAPEFLDHSPVEDEPDAVSVFHDLLTDLKVAMPDMQLAVSGLDADGEMLRGRLAMTGTKDGPLWGSPPSGKDFQWNAENLPSGTYFCRFIAQPGKDGESIRQTRKLLFLK